MVSGLFIALAGVTSAVVFSGIGSSIGIGLAAQVAAGAMSEDPKAFGKYLLLLALPGTQGIYGFVIAFLWLLKLGIMAANPVTLTIETGLAIFFSCLSVGLAGFLSAIHQGKVCASGIELVAKRPTETGKALVMGVFVEFYAVLGLLISIFAWIGLKI